MKLTVYERLMLQQVLPSAAPQRGSFVMMKAVRDLADETGFSAEEVERLNLRQDEGSITWDEEAEFEKDIGDNPVVLELILDALHWLDEQERLDVRLLGLCEKAGYEGLPEENEETEE